MVEETENKPAENEGTEEPTETPSAQEEPSDSPLIAAARKENDRKEELLKKEEGLIARREKLQANAILGGGSQAGQSVENKEETNKEYVERIQRTGKV
ncbi:MAG: hypothetical protein CMI54_01840 [Parcubacteria group bacterium]|nr:hypothetical protein [Parcubacteria group bacterium]|tara:strand:+ start:5283 stop:5576 length:294 start_codon:yes stop_codon:yes gene_type:complete